ncbi:c-type cytochrome [Sulfitobacter sp. LCG007]
MLRTVAALALVCAGVIAMTFWVLTRPAVLPDGYASSHAPDAANGALVFAAGGCASCHADTEAGESAAPVLSGGLALPSDFGTFRAPNISPDPQHGIGNWTFEEFARAVTLGVAPGGKHLYPAFPYTAYTHATPEDIADLWAYMQTLPPSSEPSLPQEVGFPFSLRRGIGLWKRVNLREDYALGGDLDETQERGRYLSEALVHCGECHTPRDALGGLDRSRWLSGAPNPTGKGRIPNITPGGLDWSRQDLVYYLTSGMTPEYDSAGGQMAEVVRNLAQLPESDRVAIAAYLEKVPPVSQPE